MHQFVALLVFCAIGLVAVPPASAVTISWVPVGNPGNVNDADSGNFYGGVAYNYSIDEHHVTVGQYTAFLNAVAATDTYSLYNTSMSTDLNIAGVSRGGASGSYNYSVIGSANHPITYVSWGDAARFANWLQNGQPSGGQGPGTTETGAYTLNGATANAALNAVTRNVGATIFIPSESEWYKAAFYNPGTSSYYPYPFSSSTVPTSSMPAGTPNTGNFRGRGSSYAVTGAGYSSSQNYLTNVGAYSASASPYGAFDMGGNVAQWNEALVSGSTRGIRGSSWDLPAEYSWSSERFDTGSTSEFSDIGFRVAAVPEPSTAVLAMIACGLMWMLKKPFKLLVDRVDNFL